MLVLSLYDMYDMCDVCVCRRVLRSLWFWRQQGPLPGIGPATWMPYEDKDNITIEVPYINRHANRHLDQPRHKGGSMGRPLSHGLDKREKDRDQG